MPQAYRPESGMHGARQWLGHRDGLATRAVGRPREAAAARAGTAARSKPDRRRRREPAGKTARSFHLDVLGGALIDATLELGRFPRRVELERTSPGLWTMLAARGELRYWRAVARDAVELDMLLEEEAGEPELDPGDRDLLGQARECCDPWQHGESSNGFRRRHRPLSGLPAGFEADNETLDELLLVGPLLRASGREPSREHVRHVIAGIGPHTFEPLRPTPEPPVPARRQPERRGLDDITLAAIKRGEEAARRAEAERRTAVRAGDPRGFDDITLAAIRRGEEAARRAERAEAARRSPVRATGLRSQVARAAPRPARPATTSRARAARVDASQARIRAALRTVEDQMPDLPLRTTLEGLIGVEVVSLMASTSCEYGKGIKAWLREGGYGRGNAGDARALRLRLLALPGVAWDGHPTVRELLANGVTDDELALMRRRASFYGKGTLLWARDVMSVRTGELLMRADGRVRPPLHAGPNWAAGGPRALAGTSRS